MKFTRLPPTFIQNFAWLGLLVLLVGCATPPSGKVWVHETRSPSQMKGHLHGCKVNTFWLWPFDWASKCMRRRGYELRDIDGRSPAQMMKSNSSAAQKLLQLKQLRDSGAITADEYYEKRAKYLDEL